jgi:RecJ-like exonuclease
MRGFNKTILDEAVKKGVLKEHTGIKLSGESLADALFYSVDPFYPGLSGNTAEIKATLEKLKIDPAIPLEKIDKETMVRLQSFLLFKLIKAGCPQNILDVVIRKRYSAVSQGWELERFADLLDACGKNGHRSLGLSLCLGNSAAWNEAISVEKEYKQKILTGLQSLEQGGLQEMEGLRYFYSDNSSLGGVIAGIAINYLCDEKKPLFSLARKETDDEVHVSCRGNHKLVEQGLDLGVAMKSVAAQLGGYGGGHKIAAGATIQFKKEKEFLEKVNMLLAQQMRK